MPRDWHYAFHMKPNSLTLDQIMDVVDRTPPDIVRKTYFHGTPADIAREIRPFVAAGANLNLIADIAPLLVPTEPEKTIERSAEICRLVKQG
jgi:phthiodiolone/phenolphthiodiolone dimycocerosates ketoreductase